MQIRTLSTLLFLAVGGLAQSVNIIAPTPNTQIVAGKPFTATVKLTNTLSSVDVIALFFGVKAIDTFDADLGQTKLSIVNAPSFSPPTLTLDVTLTFPTDLINGLNRSYNLTCGEFFTLGAENTPSTSTSAVQVFVASP
ncbi:hypothetical protein JB92DRAFT_3127708 [Gautieria morchelliformis]|nr:hypothetical protein JB92DRAFT_3127708 [Gautieria morchelliformis]